MAIGINAVQSEMNSCLSLTLPKFTVLRVTTSLMVLALDSLAHLHCYRIILAFINRRPYLIDFCLFVYFMCANWEKPGYVCRCINKNFTAKEASSYQRLNLQVV